MKFAVVGLAYSHPYTYTQILQRMGHTISHVWDDDPQRLKEFAEQFGALPVASPRDIPIGEIDGVIATSRIPERIDHAVLFPREGRSHLFQQTGGDVRVAARKIAGHRPANGHALAQHIGAAVCASHSDAQGPSRHRAKLALSSGPRDLRSFHQSLHGGTGHLAGRPVAGRRDRSSIWACTRWRCCRFSSARASAGLVPRRRRATSSSPCPEDAAVIGLEWEGGLPGMIEVPCGVKGESFGVEVFGREAILGFSIPKGDIRDASGAALGDVDPWVEFGYAGADGGVRRDVRGRGSCRCPSKKPYAWPRSSSPPAPRPEWVSRWRSVEIVFIMSSRAPRGDPT